MNNIQFKSRIDTLETKEPLTNRSNLETNDLRGTETRYDKNMNIITKYNPNKVDNEYSKDYKLSKTIKDLNTLQNQLTVIDREQVAIRRIDIATDISKDFDDISKFLDLTHKCIRTKELNGKAWSNVDETDLNTSNYLYRNRFKLEIEFYNKKKESNNKANYPTRLELRFLRIYSKDFKLHINNAIDLWKSMPDNLEHVEKQMISILTEKWLQEKRINQKLKFSTFIYKYSKYIYTQNILKAIYSQTELTRSFKSWLQDYRKTYSIEFYTKNNLIKFSKNVVKSLKDYLKN